MAIKANEVTKPTLSVEEVQIDELGSSPVRVHGQLLRAIRSLQSEAEATGATWEIPLFHKCIRTEEGEPALTMEEWEVFQVRHKNAWQKLMDAIARVNGWDVEDSEKK